MTITEYRPEDIVLFCDTGREHPKTYKFINDFEAFEGIPVTRISYPGGFEALLASRKNKQLPYRMLRFCTEQLKVNTAKRYLKSIGIIRYQNMIGFRSDEPVRVKRHVEKFKKVKTIFPLHDRGITKQMINDFWSRKDYNLEIPSILGNCTLCFMKGKNAIMSILSLYPELAEPWISDEERNVNGFTYLHNVSMKDLRDMAQNNLFKDYDLRELNPAFDCACTT